MTISELRQLYHKQLSSLYPEHEIESIFLHVTGDLLNYSKIEIHQNRNQNIIVQDEKKMSEIFERLLSGEPLQYILGYTDFYGIKIIVDPRVLIPRPETEELVDLALKSLHTNNSLRLLDLCTGSGCIAIAMAKNMKNGRITATDISSEALEVATLNAHENGVFIEFKSDDIFHPSSNHPRYDCIICNPPYVRQSEKQLMHKNILDYEPAIALFVEDSDPLIYYKAIADFGMRFLKPQGDMFLEINEALGVETAQLFLSAGYSHVEIIRDLNNKNRFVKMKR